ncbi:MAG: hypothetical protein EBZ49_00445 [Proteobacteria bacterium]|nr:hypothetical protein [Pseudomonadota bacterium]
MSCGTLQNISFSDLKTAVLSTGPISRILVKWDIAPTTQNLNNLLFHVYRGESPNELTQISEKPIPANGLREFVDYTGKLKNFEKVYYYQVKAHEIIDGVTVQTFPSPVESMEGNPDLVAMYIIEEHLFAFQKVFGTPIIIFKKMREGDSCPVCWDPVLKRVTKSNCKTCHGTGFVQGYYAPLEGWADLNPDPKLYQIADWGQKQPSQTDMQFTNYPLLGVGDVVVELKQNRYWRIVNVRNTEKNRTTILQVARLDEINRSDVELSLNIPDEMRMRLLNELDAREKTPEF